MADDIPPGFRVVSTPNAPPASPIGPFPGMIAQGNIDLNARPIVKNPDGSYSTVRSMSFENDGGQEVLVPTVSPDGKIMSDQQSMELYGRTGQNLGKFDNPAHADMYAEALHKAQDQHYAAQTQPAAGDDLPPGFSVVKQPQAEQGIGQPEGVPTYSPPGVEGYDPKTGEVQKYSGPGSAAMGAANATTFGFGDELASYLASTFSGVPRDQVLSEMRGDASQARADNPKSYVAGEVGGGLAQAAATGGAGFGLNAAKTGAGLGGVALGGAADGAIQGALNGAGNADGDFMDRLRGLLTGGTIGAAVGGAAPYVTSAAGSLVRRIISPFASSPEREAAVNLLAQEGVPVTAGQRTGSNTLRYAESELGGQKAANAAEQTAEAFTDAAMRKAGGSGRATPDNMLALRDSLGQEFEAISNRNTLTADPQLGNEIGATLNRYDKLLEAQQKPIINGLADDIVKRLQANGGTLPGAEYQVIRSDLSRASASTGNPTLAAAFRGLRDALDGAMDRSISPADAAKWAELRGQYGNMKVLQRAATGGGEESGLGIISPAQLRVAAASGNREGFATGASDFTDLAKAGQAVLTKLPNSGTAARSAIRNGIPLSAGLGGVVAGIPGMIAGMAVPRLAGRALMSGPGQAYLGNQVAAGATDPVTNAVLAVMARQGAISPLIAGPAQDR
ncbi:MAG: hypothetical protein EOS52_30080 [Mesorhizobium sp.]|uniref:hypothetical protein n=1 Tax=Mesorhizobium sp. TaxID=1871066 RepID=UPI000FE4E4AD|nr:hypothetical protein [Mesorhizobium sp.]RWC08624.1 MAG: hypothetical protein EOS52_30080 [Mesorhizobium sp.]